MPCPHCLPRIIGLLRAMLATWLVALLLPGCSAIKIAYNQSPELAHWWADSYLDLDDAQSQLLRRDLTALLQWHRSQRLPAYAELLQRTQRLAPGEVSTAQACGLAQELFGQVNDLLAQSAPTVAGLAQSLTATQLQHLQRQFEKRDQEWREEWLEIPAAELKKKRSERVIERSESFYGRLDRAQKDLLRQAVEQSEYSAATQWVDRQRRQADILQTLTLISRDKPAPELAQQQVRAMLARLLRPPAPDLLRYFDGQLQEGCGVTARLHNSTTPAQRQRAVRALKGYEDDLRQLAAQTAR